MPTISNIVYCTVACCCLIPFICCFGAAVFGAAAAGGATQRNQLPQREQASDENLDEAENLVTRN